MSLLTRKIRLKKGTRRTVALTLLVCFGFLGALFYHRENVSRETSSTNHEELSVGELDQAFRKAGIEEFRKEKSRLKSQVSVAMAKDASRAEPIAVYLFPELLPNEHFEKSVALEGWIPLQAQIEASPGTAESRASFEEMRAQIWIYENPDSKAPTLSQTAEEVVRLYDDLSRRQE